MFHGCLDYFQKLPHGGRSNTKPGDHSTPNTHNHGFDLFYHVWGVPTRVEIHWNSIWLRTHSHTTSHYIMILEVCWDGLWTLSSGLFKFHGCRSWPLHDDLSPFWIGVWTGSYSFKRDLISLYLRRGHFTGCNLNLWNFVLWITHLTLTGRALRLASIRNTWSMTSRFGGCHYES